MKKLLLLSIALCATLACHAAEPEAKAPMPAASAASAAIKLPKGRCPTMPPPQMVLTRATGEFHYVARFLLKADGSIENIRIEGRGPRGLSDRIGSAIAGYRCLAAEADQEIVQTFDFKVS
ncbi:hypothetical protein [Roseateles asaccharophilus]|uniref:TonB C-terminal domain-containing protein n=1 Tax=Roseateles asaccharophilus TaxID=582607 RepID=A0ABU2A8I3_9BURK|nr:hypothetical protein [Roseateles asaccharophilus]MDR7333509.1 hypothetical protein [Roseateles asaccharophilus]